MDFLQRLAGQLKTGDWQNWDSTTRIVAVVVVALVVYLVLSRVLPALLRLLLPGLLVLLLLVVLWVAFPNEICSFSWTANLPGVCAH